MVTCKRCGCQRVVKSGFKGELQRYECKECCCNFVEGDRRIGKDIEMKSLAAMISFTI